MFFDVMILINTWLKDHKIEGNCSIIFINSKGQTMSNTVKKNVKFPDHIDCDEKLFLTLLKESLSLNTLEKSRVLQSIPVLSQFQIEELINVWIDERKNFVQLLTDEKEIVQNLIIKSAKEWLTICYQYDIPELYSETELVRAIKAFMQTYDDEPCPPLFKFDDKNVDDKNVDDENIDDENIDDKNDNEFNLIELSNMKEVIQQINNEKLTVLSPSQAIKNVQKIVIGQEDALKKLATAFFYHKIFEINSQLYQEKKGDMKIGVKQQQNSMDYIRQSPILLLGNTGTGKTHLIKSLIKQYDFNLVIIDCSTLVRTGIVGTNLDTIGRMIYEQADKNCEKAKFAVIYLDEFDKLFLTSNFDDSFSNIATQLLTVIEGSAPFPIEHHNKDYYPTHINSENMLFILSGSFGIHQKILSKTNIGFHQEKNDKKIKDFNHLFLTECGLPDELAGRIGQIIYLNPLDIEGYCEILYNSPSSPWNILKSQLKMVDCSVELPKKIVYQLITENKKEIERFGARGLYQAFYRLPCITDIMMQASEKPFQHFTIQLPK